MKPPVMLRVADASRIRLIMAGRKPAELNSENRARMPKINPVMMK